jgi:hypothetical protein
MADTHTSVGSGLASAAGTWDKGAAPADGDAVVIAAGHDVIWDIDGSAWTTGLTSVVITGHNTTPGSLRVPLAADSPATLVGCIALAAAGTISGSTGAVTLHGRLIANAEGTWAGTTPTPFASKLIITNAVGVTSTASSVDGTHLDVNMRCAEPTNPFVTIYTKKATVASINTGTDVITCTGSHGWAANTAVMMRLNGAGALPTLQLSGVSLPVAQMVFYVLSPSGADLKLATVSGGTAVDITAAGTGTIELYDGVASGSDHANVLEDITDDEQWVATAAVVLVDTNDLAGYDQQRLTLLAKDHPDQQIQLSANIDSMQYPGARVWLVQRNVEVRSSCTTGVNIVTTVTNGVFGAIRSTAGTGTTFYGIGIIYGIGSSAATIAGCTNGINSGSGHSVATIVGCTSGIYSGSGHSAATIAGCTYGINASSGHTAATIVGCNYGIIYGIGSSAATIAGCTNGIYGGSGHSAATIVGCTSGIIYSMTRLTGAVMAGNTRDLYNTILDGYNVSLLSATQNGCYKYVTLPMPEIRFASLVRNLNGVTGALGAWAQGGFTKSATYASGTHGTPPITAPNGLVHETTFEDSDRVNYVEFPVRVPANTPLYVAMHGKLTAHDAFTTTPSVGIYDPTLPWQSDALNASSAMAHNTDWQTLTAVYTPTYERELMVRMQGVGGNAGGTGTEKLYWLLQTYVGARHVIGNRSVRGMMSV